MYIEQVQRCASQAAPRSTHRFLCDRFILFVIAIFSVSLTLAEPETKSTFFEIEAQPARTSLSLYAKQADVQLGFAADAVGDILTNAVNGVYDNAEALEILLKGTGLEAEQGEEGVLVRRIPQTEATGTANETASRLAENNSLQFRSMAHLDSQTPTESSHETSDSEYEDTNTRKREEIVVTGSRLRGAHNASPVVTISRQDIDTAGFGTVEQLIEALPQNYGAGASLDTRTDEGNSQHFIGAVELGNQAGGSSVNLRGLGPSSTLVLLNGRRMSPSGRTAGFTNISSIPLAAIERVEVVTDGASAIYGSDAIGGVINFILRDDFEGAETRLRYASGKHGDASSASFAQTFGAAWNSGNALLTYEFRDSDSLANSARDITSTTDLRRFGGTDRRTVGGHPANIDAGGRLWAIPAGQDGTSLTAADFDPASPPNLYNSRAAGDVLPGLQQHSAFLSLLQRVGPVDLFAELQRSAQETYFRRTRGNVSFDVTAENPFFVDPTGSGLTTVRVDNYSFEHDFAEVQFGDIDSFGATLGAQFQMGEEWNAEIFASWYKAETKSGRNDRLDQDALATALLQTDPSLAFNPFSAGPANSGSVIESLLDRTPAMTSQSENELRSVSINVDGSIVEVPGGAAQLAMGLEYRTESLLTANSFTSAGEVVSDLGPRGILAAYAELWLPIVGLRNDRRGLRRLEVSLATRYENYDDFGDTVNPKVGVIWSPSQSLDVRWTYGTSFRAPDMFNLDITNLSENASIYVPQSLVDVGIIPFPMIFRTGGNENLQPEKAVTWTAGIEWSPERMDGGSLQLTYFNIDFEDRIEFPANELSLVTDPRFRTLVNSSPTTQEIEALINDPRWDNVFGIPEADILSGAAPVGAIFDLRIGNLSRFVVTGIDMQLSYGLETALGSFDFAVNGNYMFDFERAFIEGDPLGDEVDKFGRPIDFRVRGNITWSHNGWSVSGFLNYADSYTDNISDPARPIDSSTTVDLNIAYNTGHRADIFSETSFSFTIQNLFDADPPFVDTPSGLAYDSANGNPLGRMLALQITKSW